MWLIIIMVIAFSLVVGPIMMLRPDPLQQKKERMRMMAYEKGIRFSVKNLPQQVSEIEKQAPVSVYFFAPNKKCKDSDWLLLRTNYAHEMHFLNCWAWQSSERATPAEQAVLEHYLPLLPASVRAGSVGSLGVCVYWFERGGEQVLVQIIELLEALKDLQPDLS